jgi:glycerol-3-phosphate dehydrogenase
VEGHPYVEAEVLHAARAEFAATATDVLARRTRLGVLDAAATRAAAPRVAALMAQELGWDEARTTRETAEAIAYLT